MKSGIWDTKLFPITKKDKEIEGINTDRLRFNDAVKNYNDYVIHLSKKYQLHDLGGSSISFIVSFHPPQNNAHYKTNIASKQEKENNKLYLLLTLGIYFD